MQCQHFENHLDSLSFMSSTDQQQEDNKSPTPSSRNMVVNGHRFIGRQTQSVIEVKCDEPLTKEFEEDERAFHEQFARAVSALIQEIHVHFPFRHVIQWSMQVGNRCQHDLNIELKPSASMHHN